MKIIPILSLCFLLAACEVSVQDSSMMELQGAGISTQEKSSLLDQALADLNGEDFRAQVQSNAGGASNYQVDKINAEKVIQGERVFIRCNVESDDAIKGRLVNSCLEVVSSKLMSIMKGREST